MLVVVALLVLMMTIIVQIFQAATGSVTSAKVYGELDDELRELDATIRQDLQGVTARFNPPLDPDNNLGYFEYIENSWADTQGEDTDDCLRFTAQAPPGQPFVGRMYLYPSPPARRAPTLSRSWWPPQPVALITSEYAEIIYFLRNGNLYRRVLLIAPDRQTAVNTDVRANGTGNLGRRSRWYEFDLLDQLVQRHVEWQGPWWRRHGPGELAGGQRPLGTPLGLGPRGSPGAQHPGVLDQPPEPCVRAALQ